MDRTLHILYLSYDFIVLYFVVLYLSVPVVIDCLATILSRHSVVHALSLTYELCFMLFLKMYNIVILLIFMYVLYIYVY